MKNLFYSIGKISFTPALSVFDIFWITVLASLGGWYLLALIPMVFLSVAIQNQFKG